MHALGSALSHVISEQYHIEYPLPIPSRYLPTSASTTNQFLARTHLLHILTKAFTNRHNIIRSHFFTYIDTDLFPAQSTGSLAAYATGPCGLDTSTQQHPATQFMQGLSQLPPPKVIKRGHLAQRVQWDGNPTTFETYELKLKSHYYQVGAGYLFLENFQQAYQMEGAACQTKFSHLVASQTQLLDDSQHLYGAILGSATDGAIGQFLLKHSSPPDGLSVWIDICNSQKINGSQEVKIDSLEKLSILLLYLVTKVILFSMSRILQILLQN